MKLWLLRPVGYQEPGIWSALALPGTPWDPWYDKTFGFVVRADSETSARMIADDHAADENLAPNDGPWEGPWLDPQLSTCEELTAEGDEGMVLRDFASA